MNDSYFFYTLKGYASQRGEKFTYAMEDYLEMIARLSEKQDGVRIGEVAAMLHVAPSSASKMGRELARQGWIEFHPYGTASLTKKGRQLGAYLLYRHDTIHRFLCWLNQSENELEQTEKIEHFLSRDTVAHLDALLAKQPEKKKGENA